MKKEYNTEPKKLITDFLSSNRDRHFTIEEIQTAICLGDHAPGKSTVYRQIAKLHKAGEVRRFETEGVKSFVYQYADKNEGCDHHFHLKCISCGRLIHLECQKMDAVREHILSDHNFIIGSNRAVLYDECTGCAQNR